MCTGFWAGLVVSLICITVVGPFWDACIATGVCYLMRAIFVYACEDCSINLPEYEHEETL